MYEPIRSQNFVGSQSTIAGWGRTEEDGAASNVLQEVSIPILQNAECKQQYRRLGKFRSEIQFGNSIICAGNLNGGQDSCQGDSGGPLMQPIQDQRSVSRYYQIGIVSYGIGCARTNTPGIYTRVQEFVDWIQDKVPTGESDIDQEFYRIS